MAWNCLRFLFLFTGCDNLICRESGYDDSYPWLFETSVLILYVLCCVDHRRLRLLCFYLRKLLLVFILDDTRPIVFLHNYHMTHAYFCLHKNGMICLDHT